MRRGDPSPADGTRAVQHCYGCVSTSGKRLMNRNVTISLGALILIIVVVAFLF